MEKDWIDITSIDVANEIIKEQDRKVRELMSENAALKIKADLYDDIITIKKLLDERFPDGVDYKP